MRPQDRVVVGWCDPGQTDGGFTASLARLALSRPERLASPPLIRMVGSGLLSRTRNELVVNFLDRTDGDWLWMVDSDEQLPVDAFDRLVEAASYRRPVMAGLYFAAYPNPGGMFPLPRPLIFTHDGVGHVPIWDFPRDTVIPVDAAGTGCLLVHRRVLNAIRGVADAAARDWAWFQDGPTPDGRWVSEDLTFCARIRSAGFPLHAHTGAVLPHRKGFWIGVEHYDEWRASNDGKG